MDVKLPEGQGLLYWLLGVLGTAFFAARGTNWVRNRNAEDNRESTFQNNLQARHDAAIAELDRVKADLALEREARAGDKRRLLDRDRTIRNLYDELDAVKQANARRWAPESAFAPLDEPPPKRGP